MILRLLTTAALLAALSGPAAAGLVCSSERRLLNYITGPRFSETERSSWEVETVIFYFYRNDLTGTYSIFYSFKTKSGNGACMVLSGIGLKERRS